MIYIEDADARLYEAIKDGSPGVSDEIDDGGARQWSADVPNYQDDISADTTAKPGATPNTRGRGAARATLRAPRLVGPCGWLISLRERTQQWICIVQGITASSGRLARGARGVAAHKPLRVDADEAASLDYCLPKEAANGTTRRRGCSTT